MQSGKRRYQYEPTPEEVKYWATIHKLNEQKTEPKPAPVYIVTTVELVEVEGGTE